MKERIIGLINEFVKEYKSEKDTFTDWESPLVAFADAHDPLFLKLKEAVSKTHKLPTEFLRKAETVISYFLPFQEETVMSNVGGKYCSKEWAIAYIETNRLSMDLNNFLAQELSKIGFESRVLPPTHNFNTEKLISDWSHKHVAFIAGLGRLGFHRMLITEKGCCGRLGSLITSAKIEPTKRPNKEFCLYMHNGSCMECVKKCTFGALKEDLYDRHKCYRVCLLNADFHSEVGFADVCGKCACGVPCSFTNPVK